MPNMQERLDAAVDKAEVDTTLLHEVVHGSVTTEVDTEGGKVPSVAKVLNDIRNSIQSGTVDLVSQAETAAQTATEQADKSETCALRTENAMSEAQQAFSNIQILAEGTDEQVQTVGGTHSCQEWLRLAEASIRGTFPTTVTGIAQAEQTILPLNDTLISKEQVLSVNIENVSIMPDTYNLSENGRSVILNAPLSAGERWSVKHLVDFQSIGTTIDAVLYENMEDIND